LGAEFYGKFRDKVRDHTITCL